MCYFATIKNKMKTAVKNKVISKSIIKKAHLLINQCRNESLWFIREDTLPTDKEGLLRAMHSIKNSGTRETYIQARNIEQWLLQNSKKKSVT